MSKYLKGISEDSPMFDMLEGMTIEMLAGMDPETLNEKVLYLINKELTKVKK